MQKVVPIIDLFAGPGGLGEGFSQLLDKKLKFKIALSIEMSESAHATLELRAFVREFEKPPPAYFDYLNGDITRAQLFATHPAQAKAAKDEAWCHELREGDIDEVKKRAKKALKKFDTNECVMIGGPPCQAYSMAGRSRMKSTRDDFDDDPRHFLYRHYLRLVAHLKPAVFVMENVKGLTSAKVHGKPIFGQIMQELSRPGEVVKEIDGLSRVPSKSEYHIYSLVKQESADRDVAGDLLEPLKPSDYVIKAEYYGIPQRRHRVILLGVRKDVDPKLSTRLFKTGGEVNASDVLDCFPPVRSGISDRHDQSWDDWRSVIVEGLDSGEFSFVDTKTLSRIKKVIKQQIVPLDRGAERYAGKIKKLESADLEHWYRRDCEKLKYILNFEPKKHMHSDIWRYFFCACFADVHGRTPKLSDFPDNLLPNHGNVDADNKKVAKFIDRFKVQIPTRAATTVMSHISKDGHYYIHSDPAQCRAWTVREAARIQTFPDNYYFEGGKTAAYHQVGNAVPPRLAWQIAGVVSEHMKAILKL